MSDISRIATNLLDLQNRAAQAKTNRLIENSLLRLSTGFKLNRAEDDSANFSLAIKLRARIESIQQANTNIQSAQNVLDIMDESMSKIVDLLIEIRDTIIKAANDTYEETERNFLRAQVNGLAREINGVIDQTIYNGNNLLVQGLSANFQVGERISDVINLSIIDDLRAQDIEVEEVSSAEVLTSSAPITTATSLASLDQLQNMQAGDEFDIELTQGDGTQQVVRFTAAGSKGQLTTSTVNDIINTISGTGTFTAGFDPLTQGITVRESAFTTGNALAVSFSNFSEAPGLDGASASIGFSFEASSGRLVSNLTGAAGGAGTNLNSFDQFSDVEGQDDFSFTIRDRSNVTYNVSINLAGLAAQATTATLGDLRNAINAQTGGKFVASIVGGQLTIEEQNLAQLSLSASASFIENSTDTGPASVTATSFQSYELSARFGGLVGVTATTRLDDGINGIGAGFAPGDTFDIQLRANDGSIENLTYTFSTPADTWGQLATFISSNSSFTASISGGEVIITEDAYSAGTQLRAVLSGYAGGGSFNNQTASPDGNRGLTSLNRYTPGPLTNATLLNDLSQFTNVQGGDTLQFQVRNNNGVNETVNFTFAGGAGGASTSRVSDLINAINAQTSLTASFDGVNGAIRIIDPTFQGATISFSQSNANFTELARPNNGGVNLSFSYSGESMVSNQLQVGAANAGSGTRLTDLNGFGTLEGGDQIRIALRTRAGNTANFDFQLNDVGQGVTSNRTVGDLVNFINGQTVAGVDFSASLSGGQIFISESNSPNPGGRFSATSSFSENNIDVTPKSLSEVQFRISQFLEVDDDTGLVVGMGMDDFDAGTALTRRTASLIIQNIDDSLNRVIRNQNAFGTLQSSLQIRRENGARFDIENNNALSRIRDVDYAKEYASFVKNQILQQYQSAARAQANLDPTYILALL